MFQEDCRCQTAARKVRRQGGSRPYAEPSSSGGSGTADPVPSAILPIEGPRTAGWSRSTRPHTAREGAVTWCTSMRTANWLETGLSGDQPLSVWVAAARAARDSANCSPTERAKRSRAPREVHLASPRQTWEAVESRAFVLCAPFGLAGLVARKRGGLLGLVASGAGSLRCLVTRLGCHFPCILCGSLGGLGGRLGRLLALSPVRLQPRRAVAVRSASGSRAVRMLEDLARASLTVDCRPRR